MEGSAGGSAQPIQVGLVAAYPAVRAGLRALLAAEPRIDVVAEAATLRNLLLDTAKSIDVFVVDLDATTAWNGPDEPLDLPPEAGLVLLGPASSESQLVESMNGRPWAYLLKEAGAIELARAIEAVAAGLVVLQPPLTRRLLAPLPLDATLDENYGEALTPREHEVLQLVAQGLPNKIIALRLRISEHTVKFHITSILSKLDASSRTEAVRLGARRGLIVL